jgi:hypothetical protein
VGAGRDAGKRGAMESPLWAMPDTSDWLWSGTCSASCKVFCAFLACVLLGSVFVVHVALLSVLGLSESNDNIVTRKRI